jgi:ABC-type uncharacterized transport system permease subunit
MSKIFIIAAILMLIFILSIFLFVSYTSVHMGKNVKEIRAELDRIQTPIYTPMGIYVTFMKFLLSFF